MASPLAAINSATTAASKTIDMLGFNELEIAVFVSGTTGTQVPIKIAFQHSDTDVASVFTSNVIISAGTATSGWPTQFTDATHTASTGAFARWSQPWHGKKRYFRAVVDGPAGNTCNWSMTAVKLREAQSPLGTNVAGNANSYQFPVA